MTLQEKAGSELERRVCTGGNGMNVTGAGFSAGSPTFDRDVSSKNEEKGSFWSVS